MKNPGVGMDERTGSIVQRICAGLYYLTMIALTVEVVVREFVLHQPVSQFEDIAVILTANVFLFVGAVVYFGGVTIPRIRPRVLAIVYVLCVLGGTTATIAIHRSTSFSSILVQFRIVASIWAIIIVAYALLAYLGNRRTERKLNAE